MEQQPETRKTTILLVDDHQIITNGVQTMLSTAGDLELVGSAFDGKTALHMVGMPQA